MICFKTRTLLFVLLAFISTSLWGEMLLNRNTWGQIHDPRTLAIDPREISTPIAPVLTGLGDYHFKVSTKSQDSQYFFDQGYRLILAHNHPEALRSFKESARLDPKNAMAYWGIALALGPSLHSPMTPELAGQAYQAIQAAQRLKGVMSKREGAFIDALASRYSGELDPDRGTLDRRYRQAMARLVERYPNDLDAAVMYASAIMNLSPGDYWYRDGSPKEDIEEVLQVLRSVIVRNSRHPGAHHYFIHAVKGAKPELAVSSADRLAELMPGRGLSSLEPIPLYLAVGRYQDAYKAAVAAVKAGQVYKEQCRTQGVYPLTYYPHSERFLAWAATFQGRTEEALEAARQAAGKVPSNSEGSPWAYYETYSTQPIHLLLRFGRWEEMLAEQQPRARELYANGIWRYGRGLAHSHKGNSRQAKRELKRLQALKEKVAKDEFYLTGFRQAGTLLAVAYEVLSGKIKSEEEKYNEAFAHLEKAARLADGLNYHESLDWYFPVRQMLGSVLMEAGLAAEAEVVYWEDLRRNPNSAYALFGLQQSLKAQGNNSVASMIENRFVSAWSQADISEKGVDSIF